MRRRCVLDAGVLAPYFAGRRDTRKYINIVYEGGAEAFMCEVNVAGFLCNYARVFGWDAALVKHSLLRSSPIKIVGVDEELTIKVAKLKLKYYNTLSLAKRGRATIVTTDHNIRNVNEAPATLLTIQ